MNTPDTGPTDEQLAMLLAAADKDVPPPDPAVLARLREQSLDAFQNATQSTPDSLRKRTMSRPGIKWVAASVAALLLLSVGIAHWINSVRERVPVEVPDEDKFVLADVLSEDGRIGKVTDSQGVVSVKPVMHERWSPVQPRLVLKPGDWIQTDSRGANAVALRLLKTTGVIVGPHSTIELVKANEIRLLAGQLEITAEADAPVVLHGPDKKQKLIKGKELFRVEKDTLVRVEQEPRWLQGFKGTTANESLGSLIATVDGRNVPLTVGYHHVTVDIRDQIARTVIEESFVNRTDSVLEGVFYFPLPQDASISGFGMWVGDQLVEADVVEKERAREIYETILREKRDPGLLEWAGGNIFKARVYPIPAYSEKRIKISYTQVLPLQGNRYRYSYALQSELLKQHPLRDLKIDLKVNSVTPLKAVSSPTHPARIARTEHSGHVEFTAKEYTPNRDFEAVVEVEGRQADVVMIPHRRGDDGYFMVQLTPPGTSGDWERPMIPNGEPLRLLLLADTSASMDQGQRAIQNAVIASLLMALTPRDMVNLATCDVNCDWVFEKPVPATVANLASIQQVLTRRISLGWTNLDTAFTSAMNMSDASTHVVYIGDGISTIGDADPVAFAKRLKRSYDGKAGTFHAVTVGSSYEPVAIKAIASLGGGSVRRVTGERGPQTTAMELLTELATPGLRNLKVEFTGLRTARVYPEELPNVPAGTQQILLGRYLPEGMDQSGEIIVTGMLGNKPVRFTSKISLKDAEQGNSFIPRLWARMHLDRLLEQGTTDAVKQDIIALSEEFNIITPYTSLLVLESDADRERFGVKRRFQMRDGEKFFAEGRDHAVYELKQKQMRLAGEYRTALRRQVLAHLMALGRDAKLFQEQTASWEYLEKSKGSVPVSLPGFLTESNGFAQGLGEDTLIVTGGASGAAEPNKDEDFGLGVDSQLEANHPFPENEDSLFAGAKQSGPMERLASKSDEFSFNRLKKVGLIRMDDLRRNINHPEPLGKTERGYKRSRDYRTQSRLHWLDTRFPPIEPARGEVKEPKSNWPAAALALSRSISRMDQLAQHKGGLVLTRQFETFNPITNELVGRSNRLELISPAAWFIRTAPDGEQVLVSWCDSKEFGIYTTAFLLGRVRSSNKLDLQNPPLGLHDHSQTLLHANFAESTPTIESVEKDRELITLKNANAPDYESRFLIDTNRHVLLGIETRHKGKVTSTTKFEDFVEVAGTWWARRVEHLNAQGRRQWVSTQTILAVPAEEFSKRMTQELTSKEKVLFLPEPLPKVVDAKIAVTVGKATFADRAVLTLHFAASQQWSRALEHLQECERLAPGKSGMRWLRDAFLLASRRHEELRKRFLDEAATLAGTKDADLIANELFLAELLLTQGDQFLSSNEQLVLSDSLQKVYQRQPVHLHAMKTLRSRRVTYLQGIGQNARANGILEELAMEYPRDLSLQLRYAQSLASTGEYPAAYAWLTRVLESDVKWADHQAEQLRSQFANLLEQQGRYLDLAAYLAEQLKKNPESVQMYAQYLSALVHGNQAEKAETLGTQWLREAQVPGELSRPASAKLQAAVAFALGQGHNLYTGKIEERWLAPLAEAALFFSRDNAHLQTAGTIFHHWRFTSSDAGRAASKSLLGILVKEIDKLSAAQINSFISWLWSDINTEVQVQQQLVAGLRKRWDAEKNLDIKHTLAGVLVRILTLKSVDESLPFLRAQWKQGPEKYRIEYANALYSALLTAKWSAEREDEAFALLDQLADAKEPAGGIYSKVAALHRLTDAMLLERSRARIDAIEHSEKLTRVELKKKRDEALKLAREGFAERLRKETAKAQKPFANWLLAERLWLEVQLERNPKQIAEDCWALLDSAPLKAKLDDVRSSIVADLDSVLRERFLTMLENLAARKGADVALVNRVLAYIDQQMKENPDDVQWRAEKYQFLIAIDQPKELEQTLRRWVVGPDPDNRWRLALGYLLAEQGQVAEAIKLFEIVEAADELTPAEYRSLADWYLVENRRESHEKARAAAYMTSDEYHLSQLISEYVRPWQQRQLPTQFDPEVLHVFKVLFVKSTAPQNYLWQLREFYQASHEFRLLSMLADGVIGHSAGKVYPFLGGMRPVLDEVRDEATADEIVARIAKVRLTTKSVVDLRALDLLELLVERRAAELQNQAGPHAAKAFAALDRAFKREWSPGEQTLMADFLAGLGSIPQAELAKEQLRQLETLHRGSAAGSFDRLRIGHRYAETLDKYSRHAEAMDLLQAALKEFEDANGGTLPTFANAALETFIGFTENAKHFDRGEKLLLTQLTHPANAEQKLWLTRRIDDLYHQALANEGDVSLGKGAVLYKALTAKLLAELVVDSNQYHRSHLLTLICRVYRTAHKQQIPNVTEDLIAFAFKQLPPMLKDQSNTYEHVVQEVAMTVHDLAGARDAIEFLLDRVENEPDWVRYTHQDAWSRSCHRLGEWRTKVKDLGDLEPRLLKFVLAELRRDLRMRDSRSRNIYDRHHSHYWAEKEQEFVRVAEEIYDQRKQSSASVEFIAGYLYGSLGKEKRAIEMLFTAYQDKLLAETGQWQLVGYLHDQKRYAESIPVALHLIERHPDSFIYRTKLMHAYYRTGKQAELLALLKDTDTHFHQKNRWTEAALSGLASSCLENHLFTQSVAYFEELIPLHQRTHPRRGVGTGMLSNYYSQAAQAYSGLGKTREAVDMASGAIVSWGPHHDQRNHALQSLVQVLVSAPDLAGYVVELDKEKLQSAIIRKAIGKAYMEKNAPALAIPQLQLAADLQPNDTEIHEALVACYDQLGNKDAAVQQLLSAVELSRREIKLFESIGKRFTDMQRTADAERAYTSIVEMLPNESESHTMLAEIREKQNRWQDAIAHWERVAKIRTLEPTGLLKLAAAQIHERNWESASKTLKTLRTQSWPSRFNDVQQQTLALEIKLEEARKKQ